MNTIALGKNELLHLWVPATSLMTEVQTSLQHFAHGNLCHIYIPFLSVISWPCLFACNLADTCLNPSRPTRTDAYMARICESV
ncbi:hypothetical protein GVAMD_0407 [Gardnerella vaginalis AMD]|nr:hypothetical protein GVAMD_0407 [Gardnerella vaginalis AMD]